MATTTVYPHPKASMDPANAIAGENTPLLDECSRPRKPTPLPRLQISAVLLTRTCEALALQSVIPYINQLVSELEIIGGDKRKVGYYVGLIGSFYYASLFLTIFQWNRISDRVGRKPVMLVGIFGLTVSMICFGLSRTFWSLVASRCLWGLLDSTIGIAKSIVGDVTDSSNQAKAFAFMFVTWQISSSVGLLIGGTFSRPADRFPELFTHPFWEQYPYFLPCFITSIIIFSIALFILFFFKETAPMKSTSEENLIETTSLSSCEDKPVPLRQLFIYPVLIVIANYTILEVLNLSYNSLISLFLAMPIEIGGVGLDPLRIGYIMSAIRASIAIFQALFANKLVRRFGERQVFVYCMSAFLLLWPLFPAINLWAKYFGLTVGVWVGIVIMGMSFAMSDMAYVCIFMIVTAAAPNKQSRGATNGLSQTAACIGRIFAPAMATSMFSFSVEYNLLGGYAVYAFLFSLSCFAIVLARRLIHKPDDSGEDVGRF